MNFTRFSLEERGYGITALLRGRCLYDAVDLYDGETATPSAQLASFCGSDLPPSVTSTGSKMLVVFRSDIALTARGFRLLYRAVSPPDPGMAVAYPKPLLRVRNGHCTYCHSPRTISEDTNDWPRLLWELFPVNGRRQILLD